MDPEKKLADAVKRAQEILADYVEPGPRDCEKTANELLDVLDDEQVVEAVRQVDEKQKSGPKLVPDNRPKEEFRRSPRWWTPVD